MKATTSCRRLKSMAVTNVLLAVLLFLPAGARGRVRCDFEAGRLCRGWEQVKGQDDVDWTVWQERSHQADNATSRNIHYLQLETITPFQNQSAVFGSPVLTSRSREITLSFWYAMNGRKLQQLSVKVKDSSLNEGKGHVWSNTTSTTQRWTLVRVIISPSSPFRVIFRGTLAGPDGQIAVDDIEISSADILEEVLHEAAKKNVTSCVSNDLSDLTVLGQIIRRELPLIALSIGACVLWIGVLALVIHCFCRKRKKGSRVRTTAKVEVSQEYQLPELPKCPDPPGYCTWPGRRGDVTAAKLCEDENVTAEYGDYAVVI